MSTNWGYYCQDCDIESEHWFNHGEEALTQYIRLRRAIEALHLDVGWIDFDILGSGAYAGEIGEFLETHIWHNVCLMNEYDEYRSVDKRGENPCHVLNIIADGTGGKLFLDGVEVKALIDYELKQEVDGPPILTAKMVVQVGESEGGTVYPPSPFDNNSSNEHQARDDGGQQSDKVTT